MPKVTKHGVQIRDEDSSSLLAVEEQEVILYNLESHVSFALSSDGERILPNAGCEPGANWVMDPNKYGVHHASRPSDGGYSLAIGARALIKKVKRYGNSKEEVVYRISDKTEAARKLNSWCSFALDYDSCKEIPYSDESAEFFYNMTMGIVNLSRTLQEALGTEEQVLRLASSNANPFLLGK